MNKLITRWGENIATDKVLKEYPRPALVRDSYLNLNGIWQYGINKSRELTNYNGDIVVPFSPEAPLSGVNHILRPDEFLHYKKEFTLPEGFIKDRVILHFGAVDQICTVYLNDSYLGNHVGGYLPFSFDITGFLIEGENILTLCVSDKTEELPHARGKQRLKKDGKFSSLFYTPQSGIWKTVWLESVADTYIEKIRITPMLDESKVKIGVKANNKKIAAIEVLDNGQLIATAEVSSGEEVEIPLSDVRAWTPDEPWLYDINISLGEDRVSSYFAMRKFSTGRDKNGVLRFFS